MNKILIGDCLIKLKELEDNSVDSIVTDPPYELGFMGKSWDNTGIANNVELWKECLRVLKPGGHLLAFSGTRTYHRMAVAIEDAGFEVRDMIEWVYGSGFPKSHNIGKNIEKIKVGGIKNLKQIGTKKGIKVETGTRGFSYSKEYVAGKSMGGNQISGDIPVYEITSEWEGWGTALKPAHEPICLARKPLGEKTVAENVLKYGTGGINIDESRVGTEERYNAPAGNKAGGNSLNMSVTGMPQDADGTTAIGRFPANLIHDNSEEVRECFPNESERFFKNIPLSQKDLWIPEILRQPGFILEDGTPIVQKINGELVYKTEGDSVEIGTKDSEKSFGFSELQNPKSIIYQAKASKSERNKGCEDLEDKFRAGLAGADRDTDEPLDDVSERFRTQPAKNNHPTVKPIALMEYLIKMVTPKGGIVLDPFAGSGSTLVAAKENGYQYIGIEMTPEYIPIIKARLNAVPNKLL